MQIPRAKNRLKRCEFSPAPFAYLSMLLEVAAKLIRHRMKLLSRIIHFRRDDVEVCESTTHGQRLDQQNQIQKSLAVHCGCTAARSDHPLTLCGRCQLFLRVFECLLDPFLFHLSGHAVDGCSGGGSA